MNASMKSMAAHDFIDEGRIRADMQRAAQPDPQLVRDILQKARLCAGIEPWEAAALLRNPDPETEDATFEAARTVKRSIYGNRLVLFAPLYVTNECHNQCSYCGFNAANRSLTRRTLDMEALRREVAVLEDMGHKRLLLVYAEHPRLGAQWIADTVRTVYDVVSQKSGEIRRVNINCAPLDVQGFRLLHEVGIGTYQCFQETYHRPTYEQVHMAGPKADFTWRLNALHRAQEAGIDDVALGALFGLYDPVFEVLGLLHHARQLEADFGVGPHTISFPRLEPAQGASIASAPPWPTTDREFKKIVAVLRLAVPYTGLILTTRESPALRAELIEVGVSQLSAGSRTFPGAYQDPECDRPDVQQFCVGDTRSLDEVIQAIAGEHGCVPSWCTACYRLGRTGEQFMELAKAGFIQQFCLPNALLTFKEYLLDYASPKTRETGERRLQAELESYPDPGRKRLLLQRLARLEQGERDLYF